MTDFLTTGPRGYSPRLILAHGAGASMSSPFLERMAEALAQRGVSVTRFEFNYMAQRRTGEGKRPPPNAARLMDEFRAAVTEVGGEGRVFIGGKSMGGRVASMIADELFGARQIEGLVCLGYPFHPPGKPENLRVAHLSGMACPALIVQGERDRLGTRVEVDGYALSPAIRVEWLGDGDHDFKARKASGFSQGQHIAAAADAVAGFMA
ncbi:MAG: alpha/beta fold hydrolase [Hyphomicrobiaceae bacterium]